MIYQKKIIEIKQLIEQELLKLDPLQHHGVFFINKNNFFKLLANGFTNRNIKKKPQFFLKNPLKIDIPYYFDEKYSSFCWLSNFVKEYSILPITLDSGVFFSKYFLSQLMLVPGSIVSTKRELCI